MENNQLDRVAVAHCGTMHTGRMLPAVLPHHWKVAVIGSSVPGVEVPIEAPW